MIDKQKALAALEAYHGKCKGVMAATVAECIRIIREVPEDEGAKRLLLIPCIVGETVYQTDGVRLYESKITRIFFDTDNITFDDRAIGTCIFTTRAEAEAEMKRRKP